MKESKKESKKPRNNQKKNQKKDQKRDPELLSDEGGVVIQIDTRILIEIYIDWYHAMHLH